MLSVKALADQLAQALRDHAVRPVRVKLWLVRYPFPPTTRLARIRQVLKDDSFIRVKLWVSRPVGETGISVHASNGPRALERFLNRIRPIRMKLWLVRHDI